MKRVILITFFSIYLLHNNLYSLNLDIGGKGGFGFGTQVANGVSQGMLSHGGIGFTVEVGLYKSLSLEGNIIIQEKGGSYSGNRELSLTYLQFPLLAKYYVYNGFWLGAGFNFGISFISSFPGGSVEPMDFGFLLGFGEKFPLNKSKTLFITAEFIYDRGFFDTLKSESGKNQNRTYMLYFGILYRLY
ncbi:MAG: hypothetical protein OEV44_04440 [Spirochaetota bacterium]|nr:hypothetical protein [Spirochaetota bacterium]